METDCNINTKREIYNKKREDANSKNEKRPLSREYKEVIFKTVRWLVKVGSLRINRLLFPSGSLSDDPRKILRPIRYKILLSSLLAYLETKTSRLYFTDNAIILSPDISALQYDLTVYCKLYQFLRGIATLTFGLLKERGTKGVRE